MGKDDPEVDKTLFERAMSGVNRTHKNYQPNKIKESPSKPTPALNSTRPVYRAAPSVQPVATDETDRGEDVLFVRAGLQKKVVRRLRRGELPFHDVLDLHGMTSAQSKIMLDEFMNESADSGLNCVLVIHGKGYHSEDRKGVLKPLTIQWLKDSPLIQAFSSAQPRDGGTGAVYVLLRNLSER